MFIINKNSNELLPVEVSVLKPSDLAGLSKMLVFDWRGQAKGEAYKLTIQGSGKIVGLMSVRDHKEPFFDVLEILVIEKTRFKTEKFSRVGGCLLGYAASLSFKSGHQGFVYLVSKTKMAPIFANRYGFRYIGSIGGLAPKMLSDAQNSKKLVNDYLTIE